MPEPCPPLTACELLSLFGRAATQEPYAQVRIDNADWIEQQTIDKLRVQQWKQSYNRGWKP